MWPKDCFMRWWCKPSGYKIRTATLPMHEFPCHTSYHCSIWNFYNRQQEGVNQVNISERQDSSGALHRLLLFGQTGQRWAFAGTRTAAQCEYTPATPIISSLLYWYWRPFHFVFNTITLTVSAIRMRHSAAPYHLDSLGSNNYSQLPKLESSPSFIKSDWSTCTSGPEPCTSCELPAEDLGIVIVATTPKMNVSVYLQLIFSHLETGGYPKSLRIAQ